MPLAIQHHEVAPGAVAVTLSGKFMLGPEADEIPLLVDEFLRQGKKIIIFDLSGLTNIDSTGIGHFIASYHKITAAGAEMRMAGASGPLFQSFHVSLLDQVFPFYATVEEAAHAA